MNNNVKGKDSSFSKDSTNKRNSKWKGYQKKGAQGYHDDEYKGNDASWYMPDEQIGKDAVALSFNTPVGSDFDITTPGLAPAYSRYNKKLPGICGILHSFIPGKSVDAQSDITRAARACWCEMRKVISGNRTYEDVDVIQYIYATISIFSYVEWLKKIYGLIRKYEPLNRYLPLAVLKNMHIDTSDLNMLGLKLRFYINTYIDRVKTFVIPKGFKMFDLAMFKYKFMYDDEDVAKCQIYQYIPEIFWQFVVDSTTGKGKLVPIKAYDTRTYLDYNDLVNIGESLLTNIFSDQDFATISGDLMKTYQSYWILDPVPEDYVLDIAHSPEILEQIHNACFTGINIFDIGLGTLNWTDYEIVQDANANYDPFIKFNPTVTAASTWITYLRRLCGKRILDFYVSEPNVAQKLVSTRDMFTLEEDASVTGKFSFNSVGVDVCSICTLGYFDNNGDYKEQAIDTGISLNIDSSGNVLLAHWQVQALIMAAKFNYFPIMVLTVISNAQSPSDLGIYGTLGDQATNTILDSEDLQHAHTSALLGLFSVSAAQQ